MGIFLFSESVFFRSFVRSFDCCCVAHHDFSAMAFSGIAFACIFFFFFFFLPFVHLSQANTAFRFGLMEFSFSRSAFEFCCVCCSMLPIPNAVIVHFVWVLCSCLASHRRSHCRSNQITNGAYFDIIIFGILGSWVCIPVQIAATMQFDKKKHDVMLVVFFFLIWYRFSNAVEKWTFGAHRILKHTRHFSKHILYPQAQNQTANILKCVLKRLKMKLKDFFFVFMKTLAKQPTCS